MPREQINTPARRTITVLEDGYASGWAGDDEALAENQYWEYTPVLHVGWSHDIEPTMQISVQVSAAELLRAAADLQRAAQLAEDPESWTFSTVQLSRTEAQKLIKATRRARDQVFGSDE